MDRSACRRVVEESIRPLLWLFQVQDWTVNVSYGHIDVAGDASRLAEIVPEPAYRRADMTIDPEMHEGIEDVRETLLHELSHVKHASFETYRKQVGELVHDQAFNALDVAWRHGCERTACGIVDMLKHGLGMNAKELVEHGRRIREAASAKPNPKKKRKEKKK